MYSTIERMDGCKYSVEIIIATLKERMSKFFFFEINILLLKELLKQRTTASSPVKINIVHFKELMTAILSVTKTDILFQEIGGCN